MNRNKKNNEFHNRRSYNSYSQNTPQGSYDSRRVVRLDNGNNKYHQSSRNTDNQVDFIDSEQVKRRKVSTFSALDGEDSQQHQNDVQNHNRFNSSESGRRSERFSSSLSDNGKRLEEEKKNNDKIVVLSFEEIIKQKRLKGAVNEKASAENVGLKPPINNSGEVVSNVDTKAITNSETKIIATLDTPKDVKKEKDSSLEQNSNRDDFSKNSKNMENIRNPNLIPLGEPNYKKDEKKNAEKSKNVAQSTFRRVEPESMEVIYDFDSDIEEDGNDQKNRKGTQDEKTLNSNHDNSNSVSMGQHEKNFTYSDTNDGRITSEHSNKVDKNSKVSSKYETDMREGDSNRIGKQVRKEDLRSRDAASDVKYRNSHDISAQRKSSSPSFRRAEYSEKRDITSDRGRRRSPSSSYRTQTDGSKVDKNFSSSKVFNERQRNEKEPDLGGSKGANNLIQPMNIAADEKNITLGRKRDRSFDTSDRISKSRIDDRPPRSDIKATEKEYSSRMRRISDHYEPETVKFRKDHYEPQPRGRNDYYEVPHTKSKHDYYEAKNKLEHHESRSKLDHYETPSAKSNYDKTSYNLSQSATKFYDEGSSRNSVYTADSVNSTPRTGSQNYTKSIPLKSNKNEYAPSQKTAIRDHERHHVASLSSGNLINIKHSNHIEPEKNTPERVVENNETHGLTLTEVYAGFPLEKAWNILVQSSGEQLIIKELYKNLIFEAMAQKNSKFVDRFFTAYKSHHSASVSSVDFVQVLSFYINIGDEITLENELKTLFSQSFKFTGLEWSTIWWSGEPLLKSSKIILLLLNAMEKQYLSMKKENLLEFSLMDSITLDLILSEAVSCGLMNQALNFFFTVLKFHKFSQSSKHCEPFFSSRVLEDFLSAQIKSENFTGVYNVFESLLELNINFNNKNLLELFDILLKSGKEILAVDVYKFIAKVNALTYHDAPKLLDYIKLLLKNSRVNDAIEVLKKMQTLKLPIRGMANLRELIQLALEQDCIERCLQIITAMIAPSDGRQLLHLNFLVCSDIINACVNKKLYPHAFWYLKYMKSKDIQRSASLYQLMFQTLAETEKITVSDILDLYRDAIYSGYHLTSKDCGYLLQTLCVGDVKTAKEILKEISSTTVSLSCIPTLVMLNLVSNSEEGLEKLLNNYILLGYVPLYHLNTMDGKMDETLLENAFRYICRVKKNYDLAEKLTLDLRKYKEFSPSDSFCNSVFLLLDEDQASLDDPLHFGIKLLYLQNEFNFNQSLISDIIAGKFDLSGCQSFLQLKLTFVRFLEIVNYKLMRESNASKLPESLEVILPQQFAKFGESVSTKVADVKIVDMFKTFLTKDLKPTIKIYKDVLVNGKYAVYIEKYHLKQWLFDIKNIPNFLHCLSVNDISVEKGTLINDLKYRPDKDNTTGFIEYFDAVSTSSSGTVNNKNKEVFERVLREVKRVMYELGLHNLPKDQFKEFSRIYTKGMMSHTDAMLIYSKESLPNNNDLRKICSEYINSERKKSTKINNNDHKSSTTGTNSTKVDHMLIHKKEDRHNAGRYHSTTNNSSYPTSGRRR
ncbi:hypothetical protein HDU92_005753 [Lobulomyces angularis]|nr:hypothetical protein HDU92_005753 [Lobulomyces angularis]